jgi:hypothetical protein
MTYWLRTVIVTGIMLVPFSGQFGLSTIIFIKHFRYKDICQSARYQLVGKLKSSQIYWTGIIFPGLRWKLRNCGRFFPQPPRWLQVMTWCWCQHGSYPPKLRKSTKAHSCTQNVPRIPISSAICSPAWVFILVINRAPCIQWIWYKYINHVRFLLTQKCTSHCGRTQILFRQCLLQKIPWHLLLNCHLQQGWTKQYWLATQKWEKCLGTFASWNHFIRGLDVWFLGLALNSLTTIFHFTVASTIT